MIKVKFIRDWKHIALGGSFSKRPTSHDCFHSSQIQHMEWGSEKASLSMQEDVRWYEDRGKNVEREVTKLQKK